MGFVYQVVQQDGRVMMQTYDPACVYSEDIQRELRKAGFRIIKKTVDGNDAFSSALEAHIKYSIGVSHGAD